MSLIDTLRIQSTFTGTEKRIADYILEHLSEIPTIYVQDLAKKTYSSHAAVIRLCKKIGFSGFRSFKLAVAEIVYTQMPTSTEINVNFPFDATDSASDIAKKMADLTINTVQKTFNQLNTAHFDQAVDLLAHAQRIYVFSRGDSQLRGRSFQNKLVKMDKLAIIAEEYADEAWHATNLTKSDCALFISYSGTVPLYKKMIRYFHEQQIPTLVLTGNPNSSLVSFATLTLLIPQEEYDFAKVATFSSQTAFDYLLDTLFAALYARDYQNNVLRLKDRQQLLQAGLLAYPDDN